jgi:peroxiredoxin
MNSPRFRCSAAHAAALLLAAALLSFAPLARAAEPAPPESRADAGDFDLDDLEGNARSLGEFEGKVVIISFWATWCTPCLQELPFLDALYVEHGSDDLVVLAVSTDGPETTAQVRAISRRSDWSMPVLLDVDGSVMARLNPRGTQPFTIFVDRQGRIAHTHEGYVSGDEVSHAAVARALIAEE